MRAPSLSSSTCVSLVFCLVVVPFVGCSDAKREAEARSALASLNIQYAAFAAIFGRGPKDVAELQNYVEGSMKTNGKAAKVDPEILSGDIVVFWNGDLNDPSQSNAVVAYEKKVPAAGGYVALNTGETKMVTAKEFEAMPKLREKPAEADASKGDAKAKAG